VRVRQQRRKGRVERVHGVTERLRDVKSDAVAASRRHGQTARGEHDGVGLELAARRRHTPAAIAERVQRFEGRVESDVGASLPRERDKPIAHVARAVGLRKVLPIIGLEFQRNAELVFEERLLMLERPGAQHSAQQMRGR